MGMCKGASASYSTARNTSSSVNVSSTVMIVGQVNFNFGSDNFNVYRSALNFDTSSIGAGGTVTQVNLKLAVLQDVTDTDFDVQIVDLDWSAQDPLTSGNMETFYDNCLGGSADSGSPWRNTSGMSTATPLHQPKSVHVLGDQNGQHLLLSPQQSGFQQYWSAGRALVQMNISLSTQPVMPVLHYVPVLVVDYYDARHSRYDCRHRLRLIFNRQYYF